MSNVLTNSASIPYGTWGGGVTRSSVTTRVDNPYTITNLWYNCKVSTGIYNDSFVLNMYNYCSDNIRYYNTITELPSGHLPTDINTSLARNWGQTFMYITSRGLIYPTRLSVLPDPFYDTSNATDMSWMFRLCSNLTTVPNFDTSNVTNMCMMFDGCENLTSIPNFDTSNVTDMGLLLYDCWNLTTIPNFNTNNVTDMYCMLCGCNNLTTVPNFNTSKVVNMNSMFEECYTLTTIPNFDTSNVTGMTSMFDGCKNLTSISNFDTSNAVFISNMFNRCASLSAIPVFNLSNVEIISNIFNRCSNIKGNLYIESNSVTNAGMMFAFSNYTKNIYCHANTTTYNTIYANMGNNTYNPNWNIYLYTMEDNYAEIPWTGNGIYRFPTNKVMVEYQSGDAPVGPIINMIIEVSPYTDYNLSIGPAQTVPGTHLIHNGNKINKTWSWTTVNVSTVIFRFFKDIPNMTANVVDII